MDEPFPIRAKTIHLSFWNLLPVDKTAQMLLVELQNTGWLQTIATFRQANIQADNGCLCVCVWNRKFVRTPSSKYPMCGLGGGWEARGITVGTRTTLNSHYLQVSQAMFYLSPEADITEELGDDESSCGAL